MNQLIRTFLLSGCISGILLTSCIKKKSDPSPEVKQNDQQASVAADAAIDDVNDFINNYIGGGSSKAGERVAAYNLPCGVVKVDSVTNGTKKLYTFNYGNKTQCGYKRKGGQVSFQLKKGNRYDSIGAIFSIQYVNYTIEALASGDVVTLNGVLSFTNMNGGFVWQSVLNSDTITHTIRGTLNITYANNTTRLKNYYQRRTWASPNGWPGLTYTVAGDTTINGIKISEIGKTYDGDDNYQTELTSDFVWSNCGTTFAGPYVLKTGTAKMNVSVPNLSPAYFQVEAGYYQQLTINGTQPMMVNDCSSNAYKITTRIGTTTTTQYQLY